MAVERNVSKLKLPPEPAIIKNDKIMNPVPIWVITIYMKPAFKVCGFSCSKTTRKYDITDISSQTIRNMTALFAETTSIMERIKIL